MRRMALGGFWTVQMVRPSSVKDRLVVFSRGWKWPGQFQLLQIWEICGSLLKEEI